MDGLWTEARGQQKQSNDPGNNQHILNTPTTGLRERGNDPSKSTGRSGRQKVATRRNMRREERVTVQGPVKEQQPDGMSHRGGVLRSVISRNSAQFFRNCFSLVHRACSLVPCVPCAEVLLFEASGGLVTAPQIFPQLSRIFLAIFLAFPAIFRNCL